MTFNDPTIGAAARAAIEAHGGRGPVKGAHHAPTFAVSATWTHSLRDRQRSRGRGKLQITLDSIVFAPSGMTGKLTRSTFFQDTERSITLTSAWLAPPWADTFLIPRHKSSHVRIGASVFARRRLRHVLRASGVTVNETTSWRAPRLPADLPSGLPGASARP